MGLGEITMERVLVRRERRQGVSPRALQLLEVEEVFLPRGYIYNNNFI